MMRKTLSIFRRREFYLIVSWEIVIMYMIFPIYKEATYFSDYFDNLSFLNSYIIYAILLIILIGIAFLQENIIVCSNSVVTTLFYLLTVISRGVYYQKTDMRKLVIIMYF
mgnify:CR=1 FL=1